MRKLALAAMVLTAGCAGLSEPSGIRAGAGDLLLLSSPGGLLGIVPASGAKEFELPGAVASPDGSLIVATRTEEGGTVLTTHDPASGAARDRVVAPHPGLAIAAVSRSGDLVALARRPAPAGGWLAAPRNRTRLLLASPLAGTVERFDLRGNFLPEAFSANGRALFVIEFVPPLAPERYLVRAVDLASGDVFDVNGPSKGPPPQMRGTGRTHAFAPDGGRLYTLYTGQPEPGHAAASEGLFSFVHVLDLRRWWAHCVDLPPPLATEGGALAASPSRLYVADPARGSVAVIDSEKLRIVRVAEGVFPTAGAAHAAADSRGLYLVAGSRLVALQGDELREAWSADLPASASAVRLSPDGNRLYVLVDGRVLGYDVESGSALGSVAAAGAATVEAVEGLPANSPLSEAS